jgi:hypothetical protein
MAVGVGGPRPDRHRTAVFPALRQRRDDDGQCSEFLSGRLPAHYSEQGYLVMSSGVEARRVSGIGGRNGSARLGGRQLAAVRPGGLQCHSGMFPCFFGGSVCRLLASTRSALVTCTRVCDGGMTAST